MLAHPAALAPALDQLQVLIAAPATADRLHLRIHVATTLGNPAWPLPGDTPGSSLLTAPSSSQHPGSRPPGHDPEPHVRTPATAQRPGPCRVTVRKTGLAQVLQPTALPRPGVPDCPRQRQRPASAAIDRGRQKVGASGTSG